MSEQQQEFSSGETSKVIPPAVEHSGHTTPVSGTSILKYFALVSFIVLLVLGCYAGFYYSSTFFKNSSQTQEITAKNNEGKGVETSTTTDFIKYTDASNRFSLEYPSNLTPVVGKNEMYNDDSVIFKHASGTAFSINFWRVSERWPDLQAFLNDQVRMSKGVDNAPPNMYRLSSGIQLTDVGGNSFSGDRFFVQLKKSEYIGITFYDKSLIEQVLSSLSFATGTMVDDVGSNIPQGWNVLSSAEYGFEIGYPSDYVVTNKDITTKKILPGSWRIYQVVNPPFNHLPPTIDVKIIDPNKIYGNNLGGTYTKYDPERGLCYSYSIQNSERVYSNEKINGYAVCKHSAGDAGSFGSRIIFIYPDKIRALEVSTGGDELQEAAPLKEFAQTVRLLNN